MIFRGIEKVDGIVQAVERIGELGLRPEGPVFMVNYSDWRYIARIEEGVQWTGHLVQESELWTLLVRDEKKRQIDRQTETQREEVFMIFEYSVEKYKPNGKGRPTRLLTFHSHVGSINQSIDWVRGGTSIGCVEKRQKPNLLHNSDKREMVHISQRVKYD